MGRTSLKHLVPLLMFFMAVALIGWPVLEFMFVAIVTIGVGAALLYIFLGLMYAVDRVLDYFYVAR